MENQARTVEEIVKSLYTAYENEDLAAAKTLVADDFKFTSPYDNELDRNAYFKICWPNSKHIQKFSYQHFFVEGDQAFIVYEATAGTSKFRNAEILTVKAGQITNVEVYFGWNVPHPVPIGTHHKT